MLTVIIPTRNDERTLVATLSALVSGAADGVVREVIIADGGSSDGTLEIADLAGCTVIDGAVARSGRIDTAARRAKGAWLLFLEPGAALDEGWHREVRAFVESLERAGESDRRAAVFRFGLDGFGGRVWAAELLANLTGRLMGVPLPEQGLLIHRSFYDRLGGLKPLPAMAEADLIRRIGGRSIVRLRSRANALAARRLAEPGVRAVLGAGLLMLRVPPRLVARLYG